MNQAMQEHASANTLASVLRHHASHQPDAMALLGEDQHAMRYSDLWQQVQRIGCQLQSSGITPAARVAMALPNGPEMAVALLGTASYATCVPLSAVYQHPECRHYLESTRAQALIIQKGAFNPAYAVASELGLSIFEIDLSPADVASRFTRMGAEKIGEISRMDPVESGASDIALMLHTSGTTAHPKRVPLSHAALMASARNIVRHLQLTPADRCLNVMALFHSHGIVGALLSSIVAGGSVVCTRRFDENKFFDLVAQFQPTWYSATPTIHQAVLEHEDVYRRAAPTHRFRFVRSSSAPLSPGVLQRLADMVRAPVIESYGMTEWSQMASTPLSGVTKPGSVGVASGVEIGVLGKDGSLAQVGAGDVVVRGTVLANGYEGDPITTEQSFRDGWFLTGDQGRIDADGYLFLTGRSKEVINRGGEKIAPREIDEALLEHPDVLEATAFAAPHHSLGEDVVAAVVLRKNATLQEEALRNFLFDRLANFKIPSNILFVADIPKSAAGKVQRIGLYEQLSHLIEKPFVAPRNRIEWILESCFREVLNCGPVGIDDNFFHLGGDSLAAVNLFLRLDEMLKSELPISTLLKASTIRQLAQIYAADGSVPVNRALVPIATSGSLPPLFAIPGIYGNVLCFSSLARELGGNQPLYGLQSVGLDGVEAPIESIQRIAARHVEELRELQPHGPYFLLGACFGATVAFEMTSQLEAAGERVAYCALIDPSLRGGSLVDRKTLKAPEFTHSFIAFAALVVSRLRLYRNEMRGLSVGDRMRYIRAKILSLSQSSADRGLFQGDAREMNQRKVYQANLNALLRHKPQPLEPQGKLFDIFQTKRRLDEEVLPNAVDWKALTGSATCFSMPGKDSGDMLQGENVKVLASSLAARLEMARRHSVVNAAQNHSPTPGIMSIA